MSRVADGGISDAEWAEIVHAHYRRRRRQKIWGAVLVAAAVITVVNHFLEHTEALDVLGPLLSSSAQDIVAGYPLAAVMILAAAILLGQLDDPPKRSVVAKQRPSR